MTILLFVLIIFSLIVITDAIGDGLRIRKKQFAHHMFEVLTISLFVSILLIVNHNPIPFNDMIWLLCWYLSFRVLSFDFIVNLSANRNFLYVGNSSYWDTIIRAKGYSVVLRVMAAVTMYSALAQLFHILGY